MRVWNLYHAAGRSSQILLAEGVLWIHTGIRPHLRDAVAHEPDGAAADEGPHVAGRQLQHVAGPARAIGSAVQEVLQQAVLVFVRAQVAALGEPVVAEIRAPPLRARHWSHYAYHAPLERHHAAMWAESKPGGLVSVSRLHKSDKPPSQGSECRSPPLIITGCCFRKDLWHHMKGQGLVLPCSQPRCSFCKKAAALRPTDMAGHPCSAAPQGWAAGT